nr:extensin-like [Penaeus vannamei]
MVFVLMTLCGLVLLVLNVVIIACIFRRRRRRMLRASSRTKAKSETPVTCDDTDGFLPLKTRTPSGSAQCQGAPSGSSARASHRQSAGPSLGKTPPREDANLPQNGGVPSKKSPARERRRKGRSAQRDVSPDARGEEECCPASSVPLPTPPAALYGNLDAAAHVLPFAAPRHVHSHTHSCIIHSPQDQPPHLHAPVFIPSVYDGRDFAHTLPGRQYVCRDHQRRPPQGHGQQDGHHECQAQSPKAYHQGPHQPYQGEYQARPMQHRGYQEQRAAYQGQQEAYQRQHQARSTKHSRTRSNSRHTWTTALRVRGPAFPGTDQLLNRRTWMRTDWRARAARPWKTPLPSIPLKRLLTNSRTLSAGGPVTVLTEEDQTSSFLETLQRPPEAFADPTSFDHPVYFLPHHPEGHGPPLPSPALPRGTGGMASRPCPSMPAPLPLPYSHQHTPAPFDQDRPPSSGRSPSQSRPPPPSPGHRHPTPPTPGPSTHPQPRPPPLHAAQSPRFSPPIPAHAKDAHLEAAVPECEEQARPAAARQPEPGAAPTARRGTEPPAAQPQAARPAPARGPSPTVERRRLPLASSSSCSAPRWPSSGVPRPSAAPTAPASFGAVRETPALPDDFLWQRGVGRTPGQEGTDAVEGGPNTTNRTR